MIIFSKCYLDIDKDNLLEFIKIKINIIIHLSIKVKVIFYGHFEFEIGCYNISKPKISNLVILV